MSNDKQQKFYTIVVGGAAPADVLYGDLNKDTMQPDENTVKGKIQLGVVGIPNYSNVWGIKLVDPKTKNPNGQIEFLKWGTEKEKDGQNAGVVEIRFLPNSNSLDKQYQTLIQKLTVKDDSPYNEISLPLGINKFDYNDKKMLIEMLKHHTFNSDNPSRDPDNTNVQYMEYNPSDKIKNKTRSINTRRLAEEYVMNCEFDEKALACLANVFELNAKDTDEMLYNQLLDKATDNPDHFILVLQTKRDNAKLALITAHENGFVDFTQPGEVVMRDGNKKITLIEGMDLSLETSVEDKINHLVKNYVLPEYYEGIMKIQTKVKDFQTAALQ
jgi:hypothetical protein